MSEPERSHVVLNAPSGTATGASFTVDGRELAGTVRGVTLHCEVGQVNWAAVDLAVTGSEIAEMDAEVRYTVSGYECAKCSCSQLIPSVKPT